MKNLPMIPLIAIACVCLLFVSLRASEIEGTPNTATSAAVRFSLADPPLGPSGGTIGLSQASSLPPAGSSTRPSPVVPPVGRFEFGRLESAAFAGSIVSLTLLNTADYLSTREALKYPGVAEGNPFMSLVVKNPWAFAAVKIATTAYFVYGLNRMRRKNKTTAWIMSLAANAVYTWVVYNNLSVIDKVRSR